VNPEQRQKAEAEVKSLLEYPDLLTANIHDTAKRFGYSVNRVNLARSIASGDPVGNANHTCPEALAWWQDKYGLPGLMRRWKR